MAETYKYYAHSSMKQLTYIVAFQWEEQILWKYSRKSSVTKC